MKNEFQILADILSEPNILKKVGHNSKQSIVEAMCEQILQSEPDNFEANKLLGEALLRQERYERALTYLKAAFLWDVEDPNLVHDIGYSYFKCAIEKGADSSLDVCDEGAKEYFANAAQFLKSCVKDFPNDYDIQFMLGYSYFRLGDYDQSEKYLNASLNNIDITMYRDEVVQLCRYKVNHLSPKI